MEIIRYSLIGKEDLNLGKGTFQARLADGRVVTLSQIDVGALLNDPAISTQILSLNTLTLVGLTVSGTLTLSSVTFTGAFDLTSGQITFPATQVPSSDVHTLDDYEEGNWTPSVGGSATYTTQTGQYVKIGKLVFINCKIIISTIGTGSPSQISGLPFTVERDAALAVAVTDTLALSIVSLNPYAALSTTNILLNGRTSASASETLVAVLGSGSMIVLTGCYTVA